MAIAAAVASNHLNKPVIPGTLALGELGLNGELRQVSQLGPRIKEAIKMGFNRVIVPQTNKKLRVKGVEILTAKRLSDALESIYGS